MKDISFDDSQAELMCHADITLKNIYDIIKPPGEKNIKDDILINVSEGFSDSDDLDIDQLLGMSESEKDQRESSNKRQRTIY